MESHLITLEIQKQLVQKEKCTEHSTKPTIDRETLGFCLVCNKPGDLICCDSYPSSFHLKRINMNEKDNVGTFRWNHEIC